MTIQFRGRSYAFRECDVRGLSKEQLTEKAAKSGHMQYEPHNVWLVVPGVGYGMEVWHDIMSGSC